MRKIEEEDSPKKEEDSPQRHREKMSKRRRKEESNGRFFAGEQEGRRRKNDMLSRQIVREQHVRLYSLALVFKAVVQRGWISFADSLPRRVVFFFRLLGERKTSSPLAHLPLCASVVNLSFSFSFLLSSILWGIR